MASRDLERRQCYRLRYPDTYRPWLVLETGQRLEVTELSETSLVFLCRKPPGIGTELRGELVFRDGSRDPIEGIVYRSRSRETVATIRGVTLRRMMQEQRNVLTAFPQRKVPR